MITEIDPEKLLTEEQRLQEWHKVYFFLPRNIEINHKVFRVYREWVWRKGSITRQHIFGAYWLWEYSFNKPEE